MPRRMKYPQMADLLVGQSLYLPIADKEDANRIRVAAHAYAKNHGLVFETHMDLDAGEIEIARVSAAAPAAVGRVGEPRPRGGMTKAELQARLDAAAAELE